ncbi:MAG: hypothetical protein ACR2PT_09950, partial [Endozoicomonas sp.]
MEKTTCIALRPFKMFIFVAGLLSCEYLFATTPTIYLCGADSESIKDANYVVFQPAALMEVRKAENRSMTIQAEPMNFSNSLAHLFVEQNFPVPAS